MKRMTWQPAAFAAAAVLVLQAMCAAGADKPGVMLGGVFVPKEKFSVFIIYGDSNTYGDGGQPKVQEEVIELLMANQGKHPSVVVIGIASLPPEKARPLLEKLAQSGNGHVAIRARAVLETLGVEGKNRSVHSDPYWDALEGKASRGTR